MIRYYIVLHGGMHLSDIIDPHAIFWTSLGNQPFHTGIPTNITSRITFYIIFHMQSKYNMNVLV